MTSQEIQALRDKLKEIESIESVIKSMKKNIAAHERVFSGKEISIQNTSDNSNPIYITGEEKDETTLSRNWRWR